MLLQRKHTRDIILRARRAREGGREEGAALSNMQANVFEISIFPLVLQIPVPRRIHTPGERGTKGGKRRRGDGGMRARIRAEYRKRFVGGERESARVR